VDPGETQFQLPPSFFITKTLTRPADGSSHVPMQRAIVQAGLLLYAGTAAIGLAADGPKFEVSSVKRAAPPSAGTGVRDGARGGPGTADPSQVTYTNLRLKDLLLTAYAVKSYQISGPDWLDAERYDIAARIPPGTTKEQFTLMLQNLLTERFKLAVHHMTKHLSLYELVVAKNGPKLRRGVDDPSAPPPSVPGAPPPPGKNGLPIVQPGHFAIMAMNGRLHIEARQLSMARLADMLANQLNRPVWDKTGLSGEYDYSLEFAPEGLGGAVTLPADNPVGERDALSLFAAVQEQLGLKLQKKTGAIDVLVIDHADKVPTEN
jgi:uncharacterized protein (TIGR03435 family)